MTTANMDNLAKARAAKVRIARERDRQDKRDRRAALTRIRTEERKLARRYMRLKDHSTDDAVELYNQLTRAITARKNAEAAA